MKKFISCVLACICLVCTLSGCQSDEELLKSPFMMEVYHTYMNGARFHSYPDKVFTNDELFNIINEGIADEPFETDIEGMVYSIEMTNGNDYTEFEVWSNGGIVMNYNFFFNSTYYLTQSQYQKLRDLLDE